MTCRKWVALCLAIAMLGIVPQGLAQKSDTPVFSGPAGVYTVTAPGPVVVEYGDGYVRFAWKNVPVPPNPRPDPTPDPPPTPPPTPAPIPDAGLRILIVYETSQLGSMAKPQLAILYDQAFRVWLSGVAVKGSDGKTPDWRVYDKDADVTADSALWKTALARPRASVPWMIVSNGKTGWEGPLPASVDDAKALIQRYVIP